MRLLTCVAALLAMASATLAADPIKLFNGKDLSGWTPVLEDKKADPKNTWSAGDGILKCTGKPAGYIKTDKEFENYVLTLDWRWPEGTANGNNGVLVHTSTPNALGIWPKSIEVQLHQNNAGDLWVIGTTLKVPNPEGRVKDRRHINLTDGSEKPVGEWNTFEITCKGDKISVKVNGVLVNEATDCSVTKGAISLQSEGTPIEYRNIVLTPMSN
jgi:3-keto-disaccharide hydrolase